MRPVGSVLERFRRAAAVPAAAGDTVEAELMPVFAALDEIEAEAAQIRADARAEAERRLARARRRGADRRADAVPGGGRAGAGRGGAPRAGDARGARDRGGGTGRGGADPQPRPRAHSGARRDRRRLAQRRAGRAEPGSPAACGRSSSPPSGASAPNGARELAASRVAPAAVVALGRSAYRREIGWSSASPRRSAESSRRRCSTSGCSPAGCPATRWAAARARGLVRAREPRGPHRVPRRGAASPPVRARQPRRGLARGRGGAESRVSCARRSPARRGAIRTGRRRRGSASGSGSPGPAVSRPRLPEARCWAAGAVALLLARELFVAGVAVDLLPFAAVTLLGRDWPAGGTFARVREPRCPPTRPGRSRAPRPPDALWRAEARWWARVEERRGVDSRTAGNAGGRSSSAAVALLAVRRAADECRARGRSPARAAGVQEALDAAV